MRPSLLSFAAGFFLLFLLYHLPEFFPAFWIMAVCKIGFLAAAFFIGRLQGWKGLEGFGLDLRYGWWRQLLNGLLVGLLFFSLSVFISLSLGFEKYTGAMPVDVFLKNLPELLFMTFIPSIDEDILTRGYLFGHLFPKMKPWGWVVFSAFIYVLNHIWRLGEDISVLAYLFVLGLVLAVTVMYTRRLWWALGIHWGANIAFESSRGFVESNSGAAAHGSTWLLAGCWLLLLGVFILFRPATPTAR